MNPSPQSNKFYDDDIVKMFIFATLGWGLAAFLVGLIAALQLSFWQANFGLEWLTFGRLRPLHTNAAIFAFAGNIVFAGIYHSSQRLLRARMFSDLLSKLHFWGWQCIILAALISLPLGFSQGKEYAELEWPIDIAIAVVWVIFAVNFFGTLFRRKEKHMYVALWFYIATIITVAVLHIVNSLSIPIGFMKSYTVWAGIQDAMVQWWYGHNAVA
ncbi:MAG: cbb3-type cytochrome c oxidase subunit I, partial [Bdellovibrionales bacterium]|nr:cbb3-type cytochrome c oxidase subunit I [Bdellovibrionales bacterium]